MTSRVFVCTMVHWWMFWIRN